MNPFGFRPRYDEERGIYLHCRWCQGQGCLSCPAEAKKAYEAEFPNGPEPIATFKLGDSPDALGNLLKTLLGPEAIASAQSTARERADGMMLEGGAGGIVRQLLASSTGSAPSNEETRDLIASSLVREVLTENIVSTAKQLELEQGDLFAEPAKPKRKPRNKKTPRP